MKTASIASIPRGLTALVASALFLGVSAAYADLIDRIDPNSFDMRQLNQPQWTGEGAVIDMQEISITDFRADIAADRAVVATDTLGGAVVGGVLDKNHGQGIVLGAVAGNLLGKFGIGFGPKPVVIPAVRYRVQLGFSPNGRPIYLPVEQLQVAGLELGAKLPLSVWVDKVGNKVTISPRHDVAMASVPPPPAPPAVAPSASAPANDTPLDSEMVAAQEKAAASHAALVVARAKAACQAKLDQLAKQEADDEASAAKLNGAASVATPAAPASAPSTPAPAAVVAAAPATPPAPIDP